MERPAEGWRGDGHYLLSDITIRCQGLGSVGGPPTPWYCDQSASLSASPTGLRALPGQARVRLAAGCPLPGAGPGSPAQCLLNKEIERMGSSVFIPCRAPVCLPSPSEKLWGPRVLLILLLKILLEPVPLWGMFAPAWLILIRNGLMPGFPVLLSLPPVCASAALLTGVTLIESRRSFV